MQSQVPHPVEVVRAVEVRYGKIRCEMQEPELERSTCIAVKEHFVAASPTPGTLHQN
jgi:hypothetical protein